MVERKGIFTRHNLLSLKALRVREFTGTPLDTPTH